MSLKRPANHLDSVRRYWRETHDQYLRHVGTTFQAGFIKKNGNDEGAKYSNLRLAAAASIRSESRVLDAGCGVCGPAIDIAQHIPQVEIFALTVSSEQAKAGKMLIRKAGLDDRVRIVLGDFHKLPLESASFDTVYFFESACYSLDLRTVFREAFRILRPGGNVYVKDVFHREGVLTERERKDLEEFDRNFANHTVTISEASEAVSAAGFSNVVSRDITEHVSTLHGLLAMFTLKDGFLAPTDFGKRHFRVYECLPTVFGEIAGERRNNAPPSSDSTIGES